MGKDKKSKGKKSAKVSSGLKGLAESPMVADLVAAALASTAAALKDSRRAQAIASDAHHKLTALAGDSKKGNALWQLALDVGRQALDTLSGQSKKAAKSAATGPKPTASARKKPAASARKKPAAKKPAAKKTAAKKPAAKKPVAKKIVVRRVAKVAAKPVAKPAAKRATRASSRPARKPAAPTKPATPTTPTAN